MERGWNIILFDIAPNYREIRDIADNVRVVEGDLGAWIDVLNTVKEYEAENIFHLGAVLSAAAEEHPMKAFGVNFMGTINLLEAARLFNVKRVIYTSSIAAYGPGITEPVAEDARQEPTTTYGISKVFSELWGLYYSRRYKIDFRALRLPSVIGPGRSVGGASAYSTLIIEKAALRENYNIDVNEDARIPILYYKDAVRALLTLYDADKIKTKIYNIAGISPTALEIVKKVKKLIPDAPIRFAPKPEIVSIVDSWPASLDDRKAREELGWKLRYPLNKLVKDFVSEVQTRKVA